MDLEIVEKRIIDITTIAQDHSNTARLIIDDETREGTQLISPATLEIEVDGKTAILAMTARELKTIGAMFCSQADKMC
jgi:hypothetical protein